MPNSRPGDDGRPCGYAIHATAVAIAGRALLILGPSRSGKSRLALALIAASTARQPIRLVGDDRILLARRRGVLFARAHPRIAGFIERRGLGILAVPFVPVAAVGGLVTLGSTTSMPPVAQNFPCLQYVISHAAGADSVADAADAILGWWRGASTTLAVKPTGTAA